MKISSDEGDEGEEQRKEAMMRRGINNHFFSTFLSRAV